MSPYGRQGLHLGAVEIFLAEVTLAWRVYRHSFVDFIEYHSLRSGPRFKVEDTLR